MNRLFLVLAVCWGSLMSAQQTESLEAVAEAETEAMVLKDSIKNFKKIKIDGIASVVGDYVILESDIEKTLIDLRSQGASTENLTRCSLLGKLMEDRLYAHQAVQDSLLVSDDEVNATTERQIQALLQEVGVNG